MSKTSKSKAVQITGAVLILTSPLWLYIGPNLISPMFCDPKDFGPFSGQFTYTPCVDVYIPLTAALLVGSLLIGALLIFLAGNAKKNNVKK